MAGNGFDWRSVSRGLLLTGIGVFLLMTTLGKLPSAFWLDLAPYWPVLLIALGIRFVFERSALPGLILLSPVLILGTMTFVARHGGDRGYDSWTEIRAERPAEAERWRLTGDLHMARIRIEGRELAAADGLVEGRAAVASRRTPSARVSGSGAEARVSLRSRHRHSFHLLRTRRERWELAIDRQLPLHVDLDVVGASGVLDLVAVPVTRVDLDGAFSDLELRLGRPEQTVRIDLEGAFHRIDVRVPPDVPVIYDTDGFMNIVDGRDRVPSGDTHGYRLRVDGAFNRIDVDSR